MAATDNARPTPDDEWAFSVPPGWEPRFRLATVLCHTRPGHGIHPDDEPADYCSDCLLHADLILDEDDYEEVVLAAIQDEQSERAERHV